jgi:hypothetical protein
MTKVYDVEDEDAPTLLDFRAYWSQPGIASTYYRKVQGSSMEDRLLRLFMEDGFVAVINLDATTAIEFWPSDTN